MKLWLAVSVSVLVGCSIPSPSSSPRPSTSATASVTGSPSASPDGVELPRPSPRFPAGHCQAATVQSPLLVNPDRHCTPGSIDVRVTQDNLFYAASESTPGVGLCTTGYRTGRVRPSSRYTSQLKALQMTEYGFQDGLDQHEEDHLIPLELGGNPSDPLNLWPEPGAVPNPKDALETYLHNKVCYTRDFQLSQAQNLIAFNWVVAYQQYSTATDWAQLHGHVLYKS